MTIPDTPNIYRQDELALAQRAAADNEVAMRQLADRLLNSVRTTVHYLSPKDAEADDMAQHAMIEILRSVHSFRGDCQLETWATRITVRTAIRHLKKRRSGLSWLEKLTHMPGEPSVSPEQISETYQLRRRVRHILGKLSLPQRTVLVLKLVHGFSIEEIAAATESPVNTVRERLRIARKKFRNYTLLDPVLSGWGEGRLS